MERLEVCVQDKEKGVKVIRQARGPYVFQREGGVASASLPQGESPVPGVPNREGGENPFVEELPQADRDINRPDEGDMLSRVEVGREEPGHMGCPRGGEGREFRTEERGGG